MTPIRSLLYDVDPYDGFDPRPWSNGEIYGWCADTGALKRIVRQHRPRRMVEVGSWKGLSATVFMREMLDVAEDDGYPFGPELVCVDTWLGSGEFQGRDRDSTRDLRRKHGWPQVYFEFLANMVRANLDDFVTPWPCPSVIAARCLRQALEDEAIDPFDVIYIDASHEYEDVCDDIAAWWPLVRSGGVLCGDDFDLDTDPGVVRAVNEFQGPKFRTADGRTWKFEKA